ncbi:spore coat protein YsxE [Mesobacillus harenae]|uniref:spore coat protein YsxE n=1 Tax=Mesobacillus harenae TaxID=2213203 RepID=UPI0030CB5ADD
MRMPDSRLIAETARILKHYSIKPYFVEDLGKVRKIYAESGTYALKKIPPQEGTGFLRHIQALYQKGYNRIVPVFPAEDGRYAILENNHLYYLMPWLTNEEKENQPERQKQLFRELARLHTLSAKDIELTEAERLEHYEETLQKWGKEEEFLDGFMDACESKFYMSPFELMFCLYYHEAKQAASFSKQKLENWYTLTKEQKKSRMVITHGKVSTEHFVFNEKGTGHFLNFEKAGPGSAIHDLLPFVSRTLKTFPKKSDECVDWIQTYFQYFPLKEEERLLFLSYLAYPTGLVQTAETYFKSSNPKNERRLVQRLQRNYWLIKNTEYVVMKLEEAERQKQQAAQEGAQN